MYRIKCDRCGYYIISWEALQFTEDVALKVKGYILSALSRELQEIGGGELRISITEIPKLIKHYLVPDVSNIDEKVGKLLKRIKEKTTYYGETVKFVHGTDYPLSYAQNESEFIALLELLKESNFIKRSDAERGSNIALTALGWRQASDLVSTNAPSNQGFIAIWFDPAGSMDDSIAVLEQVISEAGFKPVCIRDEHFAERIMDKALGEIRRSKFVVIDLTGSRPSVFFEAGFANGLGIEAIYVYRSDAEKTAALDFYTKHYQCYGYKDSTDLYETVKNVIRARYSTKES